MHDRLGAVRTVREMGMAIDQARQNRHIREVNDVRSDRNRETFADRLNLSIANKNGLIGQHNARVDINEMTCFDGCDLGR